MWIENLAKRKNLVEASISDYLQQEQSKLNRLLKIEEKDQAITKIVHSEIGNDPRKEVIYRISNLTSDSLPAKIKVAIKQEIRSDLDKMLENEEITDNDIYVKLQKRISKRVIKNAVRFMQRDKYQLLMDPTSNLDNILPKT
jgi:hypothetical protein